MPERADGGAMDKTIVFALISAAAAISGIALGWMGRARSNKRETVQEASSGAALRSDMDYIKRGVDDIRIDQRVQGQRLDALSVQAARLEESVKSAHHRIDEIKSRGA